MICSTQQYSREVTAGRRSHVGWSALSAVLLLAVAAFADPWPDEVLEVSYGVGAGFGQGHFPQNVLGPPDPAATPTTPSANPEELLSLGSGGWIVLAFQDGGIVDGPGVDFTVFENAFYVGGGDMVFRETAYVELSDDGVTWLRFPVDEGAWSGLAGCTPTDGSADPTNPEASGGDAFDLAELGLASAQYLKLIDTDGEVADGGPSFELDAVAVIHGEDGSDVAPSPPQPKAPAFTAWPNPFNHSVTFGFTPGRPWRVEVFSLTGRRVADFSVRGARTTWQPKDLAAGVYLLRAVRGGDVVASRRLVYLP